MARHGRVVRFSDLLEHGGSKQPYDPHSIDDGSAIYEAWISDFRDGSVGQRYEAKPL
ncbi:hypothetical protein K0M31_006028 [Melipona bicolor]|uniref:Uncharacterized protein n=1 Tax=Melipona bicolor TaxID=60889 RepID=A0AA40FTD5_9HYME|nr:hypothetical protein K0M31_006028 [Melipona bicolor]